MSDGLGPAMQPAGWYADPYGRAIQRYFNGQAWTGYVVDAAGNQRIDDADQAQGGPQANAGQGAIVIQNIMQAPQPQQMLPVGLPAFGTKSVGLAFALAFFFGPLGLMYVTVAGGLILFAIAVVLAIPTYGFALFSCWIASMIWAVSGANSHNQQLYASMRAPQPIHGYMQPPTAWMPGPIGSSPQATDPGRFAPPPPPPLLPPPSSG